MTKKCNLSIFIIRLVFFSISFFAFINQAIASTINLKDIKSQYVSISHGQIEYYTFGKGKPIILIPGYATDITSWNQIFLSELSKSHQLIILNNRNVGGSTVYSSNYDSKDLATDVFQLIKKLHLNKPAILGISMGGMIAQQLAIDHATHLSYLILINTMIAGKYAVHPDDKVKMKMRDMPRNKLGLYTTALQLFFPSSQRLQMAYVLIVDRFLPANYKEIDPKNILDQQQNLIRRWSKNNLAANKLKTLNLPTLILNGEADAVIPPINSLILAKTIPHARLVRWKEGGHAMIFQFPKEIARVINDYSLKYTR